MNDLDELFAQLEEMTNGEAVPTKKVESKQTQEPVSSPVEQNKAYLKFESETEEKLIAGYFFKDRSTFLKLAQYLTTKNWKKSSYFNDNKLQFLINTCFAYSEKYKQMPTEDIIFSEIEKCNDMDDYLKEKTKTLFSSLRSVDYSQYSEDYIKDEAVKFIKRERALEANYMCDSEIQKGNFDNLDKIMRKAINVNLDKDLGVSIKDVKATLPLIQEVHDDSLGCTWGSKTLDDRLGRIQPGEIAAIAGLPGAGKTAWLGHFAIENVKKGKNVLMFSFEVSTQRLLTRIYKSLGNKKTSDLLNMTAEEADKIYNDSALGDLRIIQKPANTFSSNDIAATINDLITYLGWKPDLIIVDYLLITSTNDKRKDSSDTYKYYKTVTEELRNVAVEFQTPLITACQLNRDAMGEKGGSKKVVTSKDISESRGVLDTVDYLFILEQTEEEKYLEKGSDGKGTKGAYRLRTDKNRNGDNSFLVPFIIDWQTMKIEETTPDKIKKGGK
jgi:replicative DNA helicase